jgi:CelD/BcsL family acetyltransferase involved in cellulose biosynthesis
MPELEVVSYTDPGSFSELREEWIALEERAREDNMFLTHLWQHAWWDEFGGTNELDVVTFRQDGRLVGLASTYREQIEGWKVVRFGGGLEVTDYLGLLVEPGFEDPVGDAFLEHVIQQTDLAIDFHFLRSDSLTLGALERAAQKKGLSYLAEVEDVSPRIELPGDWDSYLARLNKKDRHELRRKRRRLEEAGGWSVVESTPETLDADLDTFFRLHASSMRAKADFLTEAVRRFFSHIALHLARLGWLSLRSLIFEGKPVAAVLGFKYRGRLHLYNSGYDPEYNHLSVGFVLMSEQIRMAIEEQMTEVDFLRGNEKYKYDLGAVDLPLIHLTVAAP